MPDNQTKTAVVEIPEEFNARFGDALEELPRGDNTLVGYDLQRSQLSTFIARKKMPSVMLLGEQGIGKTALVEQVLYDYSLTDHPIVCIRVMLEKMMGNLGEEKGISALAQLLYQMPELATKIKADNPDINPRVVLFIDEVHKLNNYGASPHGSSAAMNSLKEGMARGAFPIIAATTDYEYRANLMGDKAFTRRFQSVMMEQPTLAQVNRIIKWQFESIRKQYLEDGIEFEEPTEKFYQQLIELSNAFIRDRINPEKSIDILDSACAYAATHLNTEGKAELNHEALVFVFFANGVNIDSKVTAEHVRNVVSSQIKGQPLAIKYITEAINKTFYTRRDYTKPFMTIFAGGTTGVGKTATAKALAEAFFGRRDAMLTINGGDYTKSTDALAVQHLIGDTVSTQKQIVILLDEIEKSHPNVRLGLMRVVDEGIVHDSLGTEHSITNTILFATSNLASAQYETIHNQTNRDLLPDPNKLRLIDVEKWEQMEPQVRQSTINGDENLGNGLRPEFLERFSNFVPFLPLTKPTQAVIAQAYLEKFQQDEKDFKNYTIIFEPREDYAYWQKRFHKEDGDELNIHYNDVNSVSVMITYDVLNEESSKTGARAIQRYIDTITVPQFTNRVQMLERMGEDPTKYIFWIKTNGEASFEKPVNSGKAARTSVLVLSQEDYHKLQTLQAQGRIEESKAFQEELENKYPEEI